MNKMNKMKKNIKELYQYLYEGVGQNINSGNQNDLIDKADKIFLSESMVAKKIKQIWFPNFSKENFYDYVQVFNVFGDEDRLKDFQNAYIFSTPEVKEYQDEIQYDGGNYFFDDTRLVVAYDAKIDFATKQKCKVVISVYKPYYSEIDAELVDINFDDFDDKDKEYLWECLLKNAEKKRLASEFRKNKNKIYNK